jgi:hypothetical protein
MKSFFGSRRTRCTAAVMLFVWLMSLGIGVANACLVQQDHGWHEHLSQSQSGLAFGAVTAQDDNVNNDTSPEDLACLNFCAAEQNALVNHHADGVVAQDPVPVPFFTWSLVPVVDQTYQPQAFGGPTWSEPPVFIRFLRLTI